jgi:hypothetical protein
MSVLESRVPSVVFGREIDVCYEHAHVWTDNPDCHFEECRCCVNVGRGERELVGCVEHQLATLISRSVTEPLAK